MAKNLLGMARGYTGGGRVPPYQYRGGGEVGYSDADIIKKKGIRGFLERLLPGGEHGYTLKKDDGRLKKIAQMEAYENMSSKDVMDFMKTFLMKSNNAGSTDTVPAMLTPGEVVLNAGQQQRLGAAAGVPSGALFGAAGVPGFQGGGKVPKLDISSGKEGDRKSYYTYKARNLRGGNEFINPDGRPSTALMTNAEYDGINYAFPTLFYDEKEGWYKIDDTNEAFEEAIRLNEVFDFGKDSTSAKKFAKGSWKPNEFQDGGMVPESTAHNAMDNLMMQNEMNRIAQENQQYGAMRNIVPRIEGPGGLGMLEWAGGPMKGMGMLASNKTVSRMIKDLVMTNARRGSRFTPDEMPLRLADRINTDKSLIQALRNWQKLNKKVPKD